MHRSRLTNKEMLEQVGIELDFDRITHKRLKDLEKEGKPIVCLDENATVDKIVSEIISSKDTIVSIHPKTFDWLNNHYLTSINHPTYLSLNAASTHRRTLQNRHLELELAELPSKISKQLMREYQITPGEMTKAGIDVRRESNLRPSIGVYWTDGTNRVSYTWYECIEGFLKYTFERDTFTIDTEENKGKRRIVYMPSESQGEHRIEFDFLPLFGHNNNSIYVDWLQQITHEPTNKHTIFRKNAISRNNCHNFGMSVNSIAAFYALAEFFKDQKTGIRINPFMIPTRQGLEVDRLLKENTLYGTQTLDSPKSSYFFGKALELQGYETLGRHR